MIELPLIHAQQYFSEEVIQARVRSLAQTVFNRFFFVKSERDITVVPIFMGAATFTTDFLRYLSDLHEERMIVRREPIGLERYSKETGEPKELNMWLGIRRPELIYGRPVVLLDDMVSTGGSLDIAGAELREMGAASLDVAVLLQKKNMVGEPTFIDPPMWERACRHYDAIDIGFVVPQGKYVGYGLEIGGFGRDRRDIAVLMGNDPMRVMERELAYRKDTQTRIEEDLARVRQLQRSGQVYTHSQVTQCIDNTAEEIYASYRKQGVSEIHMVCVPGAEMFGRELSQALARYGDLKINNSSRVSGKYVLVADVDGAADNVCLRLQTDAPREMKIVSLVEEPFRRQDWACFKDTRQIVGFGRGGDYSTKLRALPDT